MGDSGHNGIAVIGTFQFTSGKYTTQFLPLFLLLILYPVEVVVVVVVVESGAGGVGNKVALNGWLPLLLLLLVCSVPWK